jgi:hypothetical protein
MAPIDPRMQGRPLALLCACCGKRLGLHKFGDDRCPHPDWRPCAGQAEWQASTFRAHPAEPDMREFGLRISHGRTA